MLAKKKRNKGKGNQRTEHNRSPITDGQRAQVADWLRHMCRHLDKAITLSQKLNGRAVDENDDMFWALAKYVENVQECIIQLDNINATILPALDEIPLEDGPDADFSWRGMKGMRQKLAHDFRSIDPEILCLTVAREFPILFSFVSRVYLGEVSGTDEGTMRFGFKAGVFRTLPSFAHQEGFRAGNGVIGLFFDHIAKARCLRIGRIDDQTVTFKASDAFTPIELKVSLVDEDGTVEELGGWSARSSHSKRHGNPTLRH